MCMPALVRVLLVCASKTIAVRPGLLLQAEGILLEHVQYIHTYILNIYVYTQGKSSSRRSGLQCICCIRFALIDWPNLYNVGSTLWWDRVGMSQSLSHFGRRTK